MGVLFLLGLGSGLPLLLSGQSMKAWMTDAGVTNAAIAASSSVGIAYSLKFMWAPVFDRFRLPLLGRRRGWMIAFQCAVALAIALMSRGDPVRSPAMFFWLAFAVAVTSASYDIVLDAYTADLLLPHERAAGSAAYLMGYRVAVILTGTVGFILADHIAWSTIYLLAAAVMALGILGTLLAPEPEAGKPPPSLLAAVVEPFRDFFVRLGWRNFLLVIGFAALYRFGDYFAQTMVITFLKRGVGFNWTEVGSVHKTMSFVATAIGGAFAGGLVARYGLRRTLVAFGLLAAVTNLLYSWLALVGHSLPVFCIAVFVDNLATAMGLTAFLGVLMSATTPAYSATQFALLTSLSSVGERVFGRYASDVVDALDWSGFFAATAAFAIPGLVLAWIIARPGSKFARERAAP